MKYGEYKVVNKHTGYLLKHRYYGEKWNNLGIWKDMEQLNRFIDSHQKQIEKWEEEQQYTNLNFRNKKSINQNNREI